MMKRLVGLRKGAVAVFTVSSARGRRAVHQVSHRAVQRVHFVAGRLCGLGYRLSGEHPEIDVDIHTLADRVRSQLGPLEKRLDIPHVHVMACDHVVLLHGDVGTREEARQIEDAVRRVPGVQGIESYLHIGLISGDTRPSEGELYERPSEAMTRLLATARNAGAAGHQDRAVVRAVLVTLAEHLPDHEWRHLLSHLPDDVRALARPPRRHGARRPRIRHAGDFIAATGADSIDPEKAAGIVASILAALRELAPEEAGGVAAVLPHELAQLWNGTVAGV